MHGEHLRRDARREHRQLAGIEIHQSRIGAAIRHVNDVRQAGELLEELGTQMRGGADPGGAVGERSRVRLGIGHELGNGADRQGRVHHQGRDQFGGDRDRRKVLERIVGRLCRDQRGDDELARRSGEQRVAVGLGLGDRGGGDQPAAAPLVLDDDVAEPLLRRFGPQPCHDIDNAAGRSRHHQPDRLPRISRLGIGARGAKGRGCR